MRICVLHSSYDDGDDSPFRDHDPAPDPSRHLPEHTFVRVAVSKRTAAAQVRALAAEGFDAFVNLCDGAPDEDCAGIEVVLELERLGLAFTGATSSFYDPTRASMKAACRASAVATPAFAFVAGAGELDRARGLRFPLIAKHPNSYGSVGMHRGSRVGTLEELRREVDRLTAQWGSALVEEFIEGREFGVLVAEDADAPERPVALRPVELVFPAGESFKHFDLKWIAWSGVTCRPTMDAALDERLMDVARRMFVAMGGTGYGRCDLRMSADGEIFALEINPNCGIFYPADAPGTADAILAHDPMGASSFLAHLLRTALRRGRSRESTLSAESR